MGRAVRIFSNIQPAESARSTIDPPILNTPRELSGRIRPEEGGFAVRRKRFSVEQIVGVLKQVEVGVAAVEVCRQAGITEQTFYRWKKQYVGLETDHVRQLK